MIELNNTEFGKKMIRVLPVVAQEGMLAGQQLGESLGPKIQEQLMTKLKEEEL